MKTNIIKRTAIAILIQLVAVVFAATTHAQNIFPNNGSAGVGTNTPHASSIMELKSTSKGFLAPRMTKAQRDAIASPAQGLLIYQTDNTKGYYYHDGSSWKAITQTAASQIRGLNDNLFIGQNAGDANTTGKGNIGLGKGALKLNTTMNGLVAIGDSALAANTTGANNTAVGHQTLCANTGGTDNTAVGFTALTKNTTGISNTAVGVNSLYQNTTGKNNTALGTFTLTNNTAGEDNIAIGMGAMYMNISGDQNVAIGNQAMMSNNYGYENTAVGFEAMKSNIHGARNAALGYMALTNGTYSGDNTAIGHGSMYSTINGDGNTGVGFMTLYNNQADNNTAIGKYCMVINATGYDNTAMGFNSLTMNYNGFNNTAVGVNALSRNSSAKNNTAVGKNALEDNTTGEANVGIGIGAAQDNTGGHGNVAIGAWALEKNTTGTGNIAMGSYAVSKHLTGGSNIGIGEFALSGITSGHGNVAIGPHACDKSGAANFCTYIGYFSHHVNNNSVSSSTALGEVSRTTASNQVRIGTTTTTSIGGYEGWSNLSDGRFKKDVKEDVPGLDFITKLRPVTYHLKVEELNKKLNISDEQIDRATVEAKEKITYTGFIAQEVEKAARDSKYDFSGVDAPKNADDMYGLRYAEFVVPVIKAIQELNEKMNKEVAEIKSMNEKLQIENAHLIEELQQLKSGSLLNETALQSKTETITVMPNPFTDKTTLQFSIDEKINHATLTIYTTEGKEVHSEEVSQRGNISLEVSAEKIMQGSYIAMLWLDGKTVQTKINCIK